MVKREHHLLSASSLCFKLIEFPFNSLRFGKSAMRVPPSSSSFPLSFGPSVPVASCASGASENRSVSSFGTLSDRFASDICEYRVDDNRTRFVRRSKDES